MRMVIVSHADEIVAVSSVIYIVIASCNAIADWRRAPFGRPEPRYTWRNVLIFCVWVAALITFTGFYIFAAGYASPRMSAVFGFTNLYCIVMFTIRDGIRARTKKGYAYAGVGVVILVVAATLTAFAPLPPK